MYNRQLTNYIPVFQRLILTHCLLMVKLLCAVKYFLPVPWYWITFFDFVASYFEYPLMAFYDILFCNFAVVTGPRIFPCFWPPVSVAGVSRINCQVNALTNCAANTFPLKTAIFNSQFKERRKKKPFLSLNPSRGKFVHICPFPALKDAKMFLNGKYKKYVWYK